MQSIIVRHNGYPVEVLINPRERDVRQMIKERNGYGVRVLRTDDALYIYPADLATHFEMADSLGLKGLEYGNFDEWMVYAGRLTSLMHGHVPRLVHDWLEPS